MVADAAHSLSDILSDFVTLWYALPLISFYFLLLISPRSVKLSSKPVDENHPYGHGKFDSIVYVPITYYTLRAFLFAPLDHSGSPVCS